MDKQTIINILSKHDTEVDNFNSALCSVDYEIAAEEILELVKSNSVLGGVSESYIKCWNCKQFEQTGTNFAGNEVGNCKLNDCKVSHPKWQKCGEYEQCGNFR